MMGLPARAARGLIRAYKAVLSPILPPACRFYPTCSSYALEAFGRHGFWRALRLTLHRLLRCHPFCPGAIDLVP